MIDIFELNEENYLKHLHFLVGECCVRVSYIIDYINSELDFVQYFISNGYDKIKPIYSKDELLEHLLHIRKRAFLDELSKLRRYMSELKHTDLYKFFSSICDLKRKLMLKQSSLDIRELDIKRKEEQLNNVDKVGQCGK